MYVNKNKFLIVILFIFFMLCQFLIDTSFNNVISTIMCFLGATLSILYVLSALKKGYVLSLMPLIGGLIGLQLGPIVFQTLNLKPIIFNLNVPLITFFNVFLLQLSLLIGHYFYSNSVFLNKFVCTINCKLNKTGILSRSPTFVIFSLGLLSLLAILFGSTNDIQTGDSGGKFLLLFSSFSILPLLYFCQGVELKRKPIGHYIKIIFIYFLILLIVGLIKNSRGLFSTFALVFIFLYCYYVYIGKIILTKKVLFCGIVLFIPILFFLKILNLASGAIILSRSMRDEIQGLELLEYTFKYILDIYSGVIVEYGVNINTDLNSYNELYLNNDFLSRLVTVKFLDNMIYYSQNISISYSALNEYMVNSIIKLLPQPILDFLGFRFNKDDYFYSYGDYIYYHYAGVGLGEFKLGSFAASGLNFLGYFFYGIIILIIPLFYSLLDSFMQYCKEDKKRNKFTFIAILLLYPLFLMPNGDSIMTIISFLIRDLPLQIVIFLIFLIFFKFIKSLVSVRLN